MIRSFFLSLLPTPAGSLNPPARGSRTSSVDYRSLPKGLNGSCLVFEVRFFSQNSVQGQNQSNPTAVASVQEVLKGLFPRNGSLLPPTGQTPPGQQVPGQLTQLAQQDPELAGALTRLEGKNGASQSPQDRDQVINLLTSKHNLSQQDAANLVNQWDQQFQQARAQTDQKASQVGQAAPQGIAQGALWSFIALLLGLLVAAWGGWSGTASLPKTTPVPAT